MQVLRKKSLKVSQHPANSGGRTHFGSGDTLVLLYHVILQEPINGSFGFMGKSLSW